MTFFNLKICLALLVTCLLFTEVKSSPGDNNIVFKECLHLREQTQCLPDGASKTPLPLALQLLQWTCLDDCKYTCMHELYTVMRKENKIEQFYGKWPFYRVFGIQELFSVIFSVLNGLAHYKSLKRIKNEIRFDTPYKPIFISYALVSINTWIWSAVFHTRDTWITERMDYFSAYLSIVFALYMAVIRIFHIDYTKNSSLFLGWSFFCLGIYIYHVYSLSVNFDYQYNMVINVATGLVHNLLWLVWSALHSLDKTSKKYPYAWTPSKVCLLLTLSMSLELFDFPPILGLLDAHALWHCSTIFIIPLWYDFFINDLLFNNQIKVKE